MAELYSKVPTVVLAPGKGKIKFTHIIFGLLVTALVLGLFFLVKNLVSDSTEKEIEPARFIYGFVDDFSSPENSKNRWDFSESVNEEAYLLNGENLELKKGGVFKWPSRVSGDFEAVIKLTPAQMSVLNSLYSFSFSKDFGIEIQKLESRDYSISAFETLDGVNRELANKILPFGNSFLLKIVKFGGNVTFYIDDIAFAKSENSHLEVGNVMFSAESTGNGDDIRIFIDDFYLRFNKSL